MLTSPWRPLATGGTPLIIPTVPPPILYLIFAVCAAFAIAGSDRRGRTLLFILFSAAVGSGLGASVGMSLRNPPVPGPMAGLFLVVSGTVTAIREIVSNYRSGRSL